jgi:hypothetical protein
MLANTLESALQNKIENLDLSHSIVHAVNNELQRVLELQFIEGGHAIIRHSDTGCLQLPPQKEM